MRSFFLLLLAVALCMLIIPGARRLAPRIGMLDQPDPRKVHQLPVARVGGWGIALGSLVPLVLLNPSFPPPLLAFVVGSLVLFCFGLWDDARQIGHWPKFLGQAIAVALVVFWGDLYVTRLPFIEGEAMSPLVGKLFTSVAMIGAINAINHSDGLDGLAGGESMLSLVAIGYLGHLAGSDLVTDVALAVIGGIVGFLRFNTHPAIVFMGDTGSQFLGFTLAFLVVYLVQVANPAAGAVLPLLLLGLPIADILAVLYQRIRGRMNWFRATRNHVHHRLLDLGFTHYETVVAIYSLHAVLVASAVLLRYEADAFVLAWYLLLVGALFALLLGAERSGWRPLRREQPVLERMTRLPATLRDAGKLQEVLLGVLSMPIPLFLVGAVLWSSEVPRDFSVAAAIVGTLTVLLLLAPWAKGFAPRVAVYVTVAFAAYLFVRYPGGGAHAATSAVNYGMLVLAGGLLLYVRFLSRQRFGLTPTDYLIAFAALALALFGRWSGTSLGAESLVRFVLYAVVLFYACEVVIGNLERWRYVLGVPTALALTILTVRGLIAFA